MESYLQIEKLSKSFGDRLLFSDVTFGIYHGDKIGIIAVNGSGKSTFLKILLGEEDFDSGKIVAKRELTMGYLPQDVSVKGDFTVLEYLLEEEGLSDREDFSHVEEYKKLLTQFKIKNLQQRMNEMSGGQIKRVALAKILARKPDLIILDEPTNHLDIEMVEWLENYLFRSNITLIMVTHDRYFLDNICNKIIEIDRENFYFYEGNYNYYLEKRKERYDTMSAELLKLKNIFRTELEWIRRQPQARGTKAKYRIDNFNQIKEKAKINLNENHIKLEQGGGYIGSKIFEAKNISKGFGKVKILDDFNYVFTKNEKLGIVGDNGVGKSTFVKLLLGELKPDSGSIDIGSTVRWGYYSQDGITEINENKKVIDVVQDIAEVIKINEKTTLSASQFLSRFLFTPDTQQKFVSKLSGGEKRRLYLASILIKNPNFLILDEPTNDLDIMTLSILEDYLIGFKGCVIIISHDRFFLDRIVDHIFVFEGDGKIKDFPGNYSSYREEFKLKQSQLKSNKSKDVKIPTERKLKEKPRKLSFKEKKEYEELKLSLISLEKEKEEIEQTMSSGKLDHNSLLLSSNRISDLIISIDETELRLLELMEKMDDNNI